jgi:uncharacterized protein
MDISPIIPNSKKIIQSYGYRFFNISGEIVENSSIFITPDFFTKIQATQISEITKESLKDILKYLDKTDILLIGSGKKHIRLQKEMIDCLQEFNLVVDCMDSSAACRTYNILLGDDRNVAALIIAA